MGGTLDKMPAQLVPASTPAFGSVGKWGLVILAYARCWVLRDRNQPCFFGGGAGTVSSGPLSGSPVGEAVGVPPVL